MFMCISHTNNRNVKILTIIVDTLIIDTLIINILYDCITLPICNALTLVIARSFRDYVTKLFLLQLKVQKLSLVFLKFLKHFGVEQLLIGLTRHIHFVGTLYRSRAVSYGLVLLQMLLLKNRQVDLSDKNIYRPVANDTVLLKLFLLCSMTFIQSHLFSQENQFSFKKKHSIDCILKV